MTITTNIHSGEERRVEQIFVKWATPAQELTCTAQLCEILNYRTIAEPGQICIVVPNATWGMRMREECERAHVEAVVRMPELPLSRKAKQALATLACLAYPENPKLQATWQKSGKTLEDLNQMVQQYSHASAMSILHATGVSECIELAHARLHAKGDETPAQLYQMLSQQWKSPTSPEGIHTIEILHYQHITRSYQQMFFLGCVDGLMPAAELYADGADPEAMEAARTGFLNALEHCSKRVFLSGFQKADAEFAERAHIRSQRKKLENGHTMAIAQPSPFLNELGGDRPSTMGGQALMRRFKLN